MTKPDTKKIRLRLISDLLKVVIALAVIALAGVIWYQPPLVKVESPYATWSHRGSVWSEAQLYRPLSVPTRFYISLPSTLENHYEWFAVDRRHEIAAMMTNAPSRRTLGWVAVRRGEPLGLDLEFRKMDGSEWQVHFFDSQILFSNALLAVEVSLDKK